MRHSPSDLPSPVEILEARYADLQRASADSGNPPRVDAMHVAPKRAARQNDRPAGRMTLLAGE